MLLRTIRCVNGEVEVTMDCEPVFDYGRHQGNWEYTGRGYDEGSAAQPRRTGVPLRLTTDMRLGFEGARGPRAAPDEGGRGPLLRPVLVRAPAPPSLTDEAYRRLVWTAHHWQHWLDRGTFPGPPVAAGTCSAAR